MTRLCLRCEDDDGFDTLDVGQQEEVLLEVRVGRDHVGGVGNETVICERRGKSRGCNSTSSISGLQPIFLSYSHLVFCRFEFHSAAV